VAATEPGNFGNRFSLCRSLRVLKGDGMRVGVRVDVSGWSVLTCWCRGSCCISVRHRAGVAQLVEHLICNQRVGGSTPSASSRNSVCPDGVSGAHSTAFRFDRCGIEKRAVGIEGTWPPEVASIEANRMSPHSGGFSVRHAPIRRGLHERPHWSIFSNALHPSPLWRPAGGEPVWEESGFGCKRLDRGQYRIIFRAVTDHAIENRFCVELMR
jgi:hypothetical protein